MLHTRQNRILNAPNIAAGVTVVTAIGSAFGLFFFLGQWSTDLTAKIDAVHIVDINQSIGILRNESGLLDLKSEMRTKDLVQAVDLSKIHTDISSLRKYVGIDDLHISKDKK